MSEYVKRGYKGSEPGHAPTSDASHLAGLKPHDVTAHQLGKPGGSDPRGSPGRPATGKQRECMEAVQNLEDRDDKQALAELVKRYSPGMVRRLIALQDISEDPESGHFLQAQRLIREILIAPKRRADEENAAPVKAPDTIQVTVGRINVPMPGSGGADADRNHAQADESKTDTDARR